MDYLLTLAVDPAVWAALLTLVVMEVVLGIDNLIFISILSNKLPEAQRARTQRLGIALALVMRLALLGSVAWIASTISALRSIQSATTLSGRIPRRCSARASAQAR